MLATIQRWGNSHGIRIPKTVLDDLDISVNDQVELVPTEEGITVRKIRQQKHRTIKDRLGTFYGKQIEEIPSIGSEPEVNWGKARGREIW